ncbi:hypothetical protein, partial [Niallia circulans]
MSPFIYLVFSIFLCCFSLMLILHVTNIAVKQNYKESTLTFLVAVIAGILITLIPYLSLLATNILEFKLEYLLHLIKFSMFSILFCFTCFMLMGIMGKIPIKPRKLKYNTLRNKYAYITV